jgi:hypothetical protein
MIFRHRMVKGKGVMKMRLPVKTLSEEQDE